MSLAILQELRASLGLAPADPEQVEIAGADPVLATRMRIGEAAAAALAACGLAAAELHVLRGGQRQRVRVDVNGAAASLLGFLHQRLEGGGADAAWDPSASVTGIYAARGGDWFLLHGSFPDSQARALELLGCGADRDAVAERIAAWDAQQLEDAIAERGLCGARIRGEAEWRAHAQGQALLGVPAVSVTRIGDSRPEPLAPALRPLGDVRALDLTRVLAGPTCGRTLAAHGAQVLRIGSPKLPFVAPFVIDTGHGKRSAHLHLRDDVAAARLRELILDADVFAQGYRSGALARLGFAPEDLHALRPGIVYISINCYGHDGPWSARPGWEQLAQAVTGIAVEQGDGAAPRLLPAAATDYNTGYLAALGAMVALARRSREGGSWHVRVSLARTGMWLQSLARSDEPGPGLSADAVRPYLIQSDTPFGRLTHLSPIVELSETPARWALPTVPLGTHAPEWV